MTLPIVPLPELRERLLVHLRSVHARPDLGYRAALEPIGGGFSGARILSFELQDPPPALHGPLVLRVLAGEETARRLRRESSAQDAASRLGFPAPRIRASGGADAGLGGPFVVMDRVRGGRLVRWWIAALVAGALLTLVNLSPGPLVTGYLLGCAWVGLAMGHYQVLLHRLPLDKVRAIFTERGIEPAELSPRVWLESTEKAIAAHGLDGLAPGMRWLQDHEPTPVRAVLCHGDIQPLNIMATWTRVTGVLDWELSCVADPELDVAVAKSDLTLLPGPWLGAVFAPIYGFYLVAVRLAMRIDPARLRYYEALRAFFMLTMTTAHFHATRANKEAGVANPAGHAPDLPPFYFRMLVAAHVRRFRRLTGVALALRA